MTTVLTSRSVRLIVVATLSGLGFTVTVGGAGVDSARTSTVCGVTPVTALERDYTVFARVRPFLVWIGHTQVGDARFRWFEAGEQQRQLELLIGTDPDRAPMHVNRWGYIAETTCGDETALVGVMTDASEATVDDAKAGARQSAGTGRPLKAIRGEVARGESRARIMWVTPSQAVTYRDLASVLGQFPTSGVERHVALAAGTSPGFLNALSSLIHESVVAFRQSGQPGPERSLAYVYADRVYDLRLRKQTVAREFRVGTRAFAEPIQGAFDVKNRVTGEQTSFRITYATDDGAAETPLRIVYQPRWWLELELVLDATEL